MAGARSSACGITASARSRQGTHLQQEARCGGVNGVPLTAGVHKVLNVLVANCCHAWKTGSSCFSTAVSAAM